MSQADDGTGKRQPRQMAIDAAFETRAQLAHARQPGVGAFHDPAMAPQSIVAFDPHAGDAREDASLLEVIATTVDVMGLVGVQLGRPTAWTPRLVRHRRQGIDQFLEHHRIVPVGSCHATRRSR